MSYSRNPWTKGLAITLCAAISRAEELQSLQSLALLAASTGSIRDDEQLSDKFATAIADTAENLGDQAVTDPIIKTAVFTLMRGVPSNAADKMNSTTKRFLGLKMLPVIPEHNALGTALREATWPSTVWILADLIAETTIGKAGIDHVYTSLIGATRRLQIKDQTVVDSVIRAAVSLMPNKLDDVAAKFGKDPQNLSVIVMQLQGSTESSEPALARVA